MIYKYNIIVCVSMTSPVTIFTQPQYELFVQLAKWEANYGNDIFWGPWPKRSRAVGRQDVSVTVVANVLIRKKCVFEILQRLYYKRYLLNQCFVVIPCIFPFRREFGTVLFQMV